MKSIKQAESQLRRFALDYPDAVEEFPWGESAFKVNGKIFLFLSKHEDGLHVTLKLPKSRRAALKNKFASPTGYGLGKSGWVTARFEAGDTIPFDLLTDWIDESFRARAPKKIVAYLDMPDEDVLPIIRKKMKSKQDGGKSRRVG